ncbi:MAG: hypothetical protein M1821_004077 [Bathelium mastoideum]|nr:MAG: hypothetical protein M1821_004077 [Bathelium mastoideum]KAI9691145.1 MAG: hypothetical protein M1822_008765 [Bathelium mastoideum]
MPRVKRQLSGSDDETRKKKEARTLDPGKTSALSPPDDCFEVTVELRSASKAKRNDHRPPRSPNYYLKCEQQPDLLFSEESQGSTTGSESDGILVKEGIVQSAVDEGITEYRSNDDYDDFIDDEYAESLTDEEDSLDGSEDDAFAGWKWLEHIIGRITCTSPNDRRQRQIGSCDCKLIRRDQLHSFYDQMERPTPETANLAFNVFDRYGRLRKEFQEHEIKRGTGVWKDELDTGDLFLFETLHVQKQYRRRGLGRKLVNALLEKTRQKSRLFFAIVCPGYFTSEWELHTRGLTEGEADAWSERELQAIRNFWRSLGFRRIGSSSWFALASDEHHRCHALSIEDDYDPQMPQSRPPRPNIDPLLNDSASTDSSDWHKNVTELFDNVTADDPLWRATDDEGNTILHVAAIHSRPESIEWTLNRNSQLQHCRNDKGETPLEVFEHHLELQRTLRGSCTFSYVEHVSDDFKGFDKESVMCLVLLKGLANTGQSEVLRLTYGCTCGKCTAGYLSPRMRHALECQADIQHDQLRDAIEMDTGEEFVDFNKELLGFLRDDVRKNLRTNKSMRQGFAKLCYHFASCIEKDDILGLPTTTNVLLALREASEWPPVSKNFLDRGGTVYSVGSMIFDMAKNQDRYAGDGEHYEVFHDDILKLPECRNDHEFGFVSAMCGYAKVSNV